MSCRSNVADASCACACVSECEKKSSCMKKEHESFHVILKKTKKTAAADERNCC